MEVHFLGRDVSKSGTIVDQNMMVDVTEWGKPTLVTEVHNFIRLVGYSHYFIKMFIIIVNSFTKMMRKNVKFF